MQTLDPKIGNQRQKGLMAKVAKKAMARKGYVGKVGTFGKLANAGKMTRGLRPNKGPGQQRNHARPGGYMNILDGLNGQGQAGMGGGYLNTAPVQRAVPDVYRNPATPEAGAPGAPTPGDFGGSGSGYTPGQTYTTADPNQDYLASGGTSQDPNVQNAYNWGVNYANSPEAQNAAAGYALGGSGLFAPGQDVGLGGVLQQPTGPSAPITTPSGLLPLGAGRCDAPKPAGLMGAGRGGGMLDS